MLILVSPIIGCVSISDFALFAGVPKGTMNSAVRSKICAITAWIKMYKSMILKKRTSQDKMVSLAQTISNLTEVLISKTLIDSSINHEELNSVNNVLKNIMTWKTQSKILRVLCQIMCKYDWYK